MIYCSSHWKVNFENLRCYFYKFSILIWKQLTLSPGLHRHISNFQCYVPLRLHFIDSINILLYQISSSRLKYSYNVEHTNQNATYKQSYSTRTPYGMTGLRYQYNLNLIVSRRWYKQSNRTVVWNSTLPSRILWRNSSSFWGWFANRNGIGYTNHGEG